MVVSCKETEPRMCGPRRKIASNVYFPVYLAAAASAIALILASTLSIGLISGGAALPIASLCACSAVE